MSEKLIFPIGFDLDSGAKQVQKDWESKYRKQLQDTVDKTPLKIKLDLDNKVLKSLSKMSSSVKSETKKTKAAIGGLKSQLKALSDEWNKLSASQRAGVEGSRLREQYRGLSREAAGYSSTLRSAVSAEDRLANAKAKTTKVTRAQNTAYATQSSYLSRLITRMAAYMSIYQVISWVKQMRVVTAEFELQQVALGALIQDTYKANAIFEQIKVQAVKSPYEIKDLVNYTKRLAAYGVEADDLMGTMNRLADISAGLGADMDRIILAYGQIQAAGVLKGTELRQLTELGIPMVDLLAQYYSTLRNEVVSTSEIFDMISKKEIPFEAVKDVLTDLTDEGGRFFDMQSKQAKTLAGQWSNMKDTLSIMFDEIGRTEEVQALLYGFIDSVKWLALNWKLVGKWVGFALGGFLALKTASGLINMFTAASLRASIAQHELNRNIRMSNTARLSNMAVIKINNISLRAHTYLLKKTALAQNVVSRGFWKMVIGLKAFTAAMLTAMATNPIGWFLGIVGAIASFVFMTNDGIDAMESFTKRQEEAVKESVANTNMLISNFKRLAKEVVNSTDGSERQNQALRKLKQQYGEIFPDWKLTVDYLRQMSDGATDTAEAFKDMTESIRAFSKEQMRQNLIENYQTQMEEQFSDTFAKLTDARGANFSKAMGVIMDRALKEDLSAEQLRDIVLDNFFKDSGISIVDFYNDVFNPKITLKDNNIDKAVELIKGKSLKELKDSLKEAGTDSQADALLLLLNWGEDLRTYEGTINEMLESFDNLDPRMAEVNRQMENLRSTLQGINEETGGDTAEEVAENIKNKRKKAIDEATRKLLESERIKVPSNVTLDWAIANLDEIKAKAEEQGFQISDAFFSGLNQLRAMAGDYDDLWREDLANMEMYLNEGKQWVTVYGEDQIKGFDNLSQSLDESAKKYKELREEKEKHESIGIALSRLDLTNPENQKMLEENEQALAKINAQMGMLYNYLSKYGGLGLLDDKKGGSKTDPRIKQLEEELSMVEKIYKKYEEYRKMMGAEDARAMTEKYFEGVEFQWLDMAFSTDDLKKQAQEALSIVKTFWGDTKKAEQNIQFKIGDIDYNDTKRELEERMKKLSDDISRTKTAKEFFDRMLGMTGDKQLSASLTVSIYGGEMGDDLGERLAKDMATKFQEQVQTYFGDIDISSAINKATGEIDPIKLEKLLTEENIEKMGKDNVIEVRKIINDLIKANADYATELFKSYEKFFDYEKRMTMVTQREEEERKKIRESMIPDDQKAQLEEASKKREQEQISAIEIEQLKDTADWEKTFEDLNNLGSLTIKNLISLLEDYIAKKKKAGEPIAESDMKTLMNELNQLRERDVQLDPFATIKASLKDLTDATREYNKAKKDGDEKGMADAQNKRAKALNKLETAVNAVASGFQNLSNLLTEFQELLGIEDDSAIGEVFNGAAKALGFVATALSTAIALTLLWNSTLWANPLFAGVAIVSGVLGAIAGVFSAIANAKVRKANQEIERQQELLDNLSYSYDRLQKSAERAFGTEYIQNYQRQLDNLEAQVEAYEKQLDLERSKGKKADEEKIKDYQNQIRDTKDAIEDMYGSLSEHFLGQDLTSAARDFASAWIDAYKEFANTTDAMKEKFQEMIQNMLVESLIAKVMERALKPVFDMVDEMQDSDFYSNSFWANLTAKMNTATENGIVGAENVMAMLERIGVNLRDTGTGLTGISRDIATASEESILGLAAGINTQNFYISQVPTKLDTIIGLLRGGSAVVDSGVNVQDLITIQNQFLSSLPTIAQHTADTVTECKAIVAETRRTADTLERVVKPRGTTSTHSMNVTIGS